MADTAPHSESVGELQVTIIAGRNLRSDGKTEQAYCTIDVPGNKTVRSQTNKSKEPVWNESFNLPLLSLDNEEVLIQVFGKRRISASKFLGQVQIPIQALTISKDIQWIYLSDKPKSTHELPEHMRANTPLDTSRTKSPHGKDDKKKAKEEKDDKTYISGEISLRLNFTHRFLLRGKSKRDLRGSTSIPPSSPSVSPPVSPSSSSRPSSPVFPNNNGASDLNGSVDGIPISPRSDPKSLVPRLPLSSPRGDTSIGSLSSPTSVSILGTSNPKTSSFLNSGSPNAQRRDGPEKQVSFPAPSSSSSSIVTTPRGSMLGSPNTDEAKAIEAAFKEKLQLVKLKLKEKRELISLLTQNVNILKNQADQHQFNIEVQKLNDMQKELSELEELEKQFIETLDNTNRKSPIMATQSVRQIDRSKSRAQLRERRGTKVLDSADSKRVSRRFEPISSNSKSEKFDFDPESFSDENSYLRHRLSALETELFHERQMSDLVNSKNVLLEKETKRLEDELQKLQYSHEMRDKEISQVKIECDRMARELRRINGATQDDNGGEGGQITSSPEMVTPSFSLDSPAGKFIDSAFREGTESAVEVIKKICHEVKSISKDSRDELDDQRREIEDSLRGVELSIERHMMMQKRVEVDNMTRKLHKRQEFLQQLDNKHKKKDGTEDYSDETDDESSSSDKEFSPRPSGTSDAKLDMLVVKLEKLDKLDELLKKIDNMKYASYSSGDINQAEQGRGYDDMKKDLEDIQKIIVDDSGKYTEKEKEDANIRYEKVFTELSQTKQYKAEIAQQIEEKRKANEPLNKAALEKMMKIYNAENLKNEPSLRDKVLKNPELSLIGLDPKAILAKHQNDFSQYLLRLTDIDELRAIRASLPKFRSDQKRQLDWVEILENKIEEIMKAPPKKPPPPKPAGAKLWKPKPPPKAGPPGDMFAELLAKRKKIQVDEAEEGGDTDNTPSDDSSSSSLSPSLSSSLSPSLSSTSATGSVRGKLKLAPTKPLSSSSSLSPSSASSPNPPSLGRSSGVAPPPPPPPPISF